MYLLAYKLTKHIKQIAVLVQQTPDPASAARWALEEQAARTKLRVVVLGHRATPSERLQVAGEKGVLTPLREGLAQENDAKLTEEAAWSLVGSLVEELVAYAQDDDDGGIALERAWGAMASQRCRSSAQLRD